MIKMYKATRDDIDALMDMRLKMLREVNKLPEEHEFPEEFVNFTKLFFLHGNQTTWIVDDGGAVGCASICYYELMPTFDHPSGRRAQIMNVYTRPEYRKKGYASTLLRLLIEDAKDRGVTEIKLDSAEGKGKLYKLAGLKDSEECMVLDINRLLQRNIEKKKKTGCKPHQCCSCEEKKES